MLRGSGPHQLQNISSTGGTGTGVSTPPCPAELLQQTHRELQKLPTSKVHMSTFILLTYNTKSRQRRFSTSSC